MYHNEGVCVATADVGLVEGSGHTYVRAFDNVVAHHSIMSLKC